MNTLILTVGLPRSGKTTWARAQGHPMVNPDSLRLALYGVPWLPEGERMVWALAHYMVDALFLAGHTTVILDATNVGEERREEWLSDKWKTVLHLVPTDEETCRQRAIEKDQLYLLPVIERMAASMRREPPDDQGQWRSRHWEFV